MRIPDANARHIMMRVRILEETTENQEINELAEIIELLMWHLKRDGDGEMTEFEESARKKIKTQFKELQNSEYWQYGRGKTPRIWK